MTVAEIEQRLLALEATVAQLKAKVASTQGLNRPWYLEGAGRFANDPVFDEIVRLGREYRQSLRDDLDEASSDCA
jgi:hypothetical protein